MKKLWYSISLKTKVGLLLGLLIVGSLLYQWYSSAPPTTGEVTVAPPAKAAASVAQKVVPVAQLVVYDKKQIVKKVKLPKDVEDNDNDEVTSVSDVSASKAGVTVTTVVDKTKGTTTVYQELKKPPLLGWGGETRIGADYEVGTRGPAVNVHAQYEFIRVGNAYGHIRGEANTRGEAKGSVGVDYVW